MDYQEAIHHLHMAWDCLCPEEDRGGVIELVKEMNKDNFTDPEKQIPIVIRYLLTGISYGNWPHVISKRKADAATRLGVPKD